MQLRICREADPARDPCSRMKAEGLEKEEEAGVSHSENDIEGFPLNLKLLVLTISKTS